VAPPVGALAGSAAVEKSEAAGTRSFISRSASLAPATLAQRRFPQRRMPSTRSNSCALPLGRLRLLMQEAPALPLLPLPLSPPGVARCEGGCPAGCQTAAASPAAPLLWQRRWVLCRAKGAIRSEVGHTREGQALDSDSNSGWTACAVCLICCSGYLGA
jgi:hypothetical protein